MKAKEFAERLQCFRDFGIAASEASKSFDDLAEALWQSQESVVSMNDARKAAGMDPIENDKKNKK